MKTNVNYLRELAENCYAVEFYESETMDYPHTDNIESLNVDFYELKPEIHCNYYEMDEEEYNETIMANCSEEVDFADEYGNKNARVLVVVLDANEPYLLGEGNNVWDCYEQRDGQKEEKQESGWHIDDARQWLLDQLIEISERNEQYLCFEAAEEDGTISTARDEDGEVYQFSYDTMTYFIKREDED